MWNAGCEGSRFKWVEFNLEVLPVLSSWPSYIALEHLSFLMYKMGIHATWLN